MARTAIREVEDHSGGLIARLDPRTRLLTALGLVAGLATLERPPLILLALLAAVMLVYMAKLPAGALAHRLVHVEAFMIVLFAFLPFTTPGEPLFSIGPFAATEQGILRAVTIALKVNVAALAIFALLSSLEPVRLGRAMAGLGAPLPFVHLFLLTVRYIGVLRAETGRLREAMRARAFAARSDWHTWRTLGNLAGMTLVRSLERAERVHEAMRCRGYSGRFPFPPAEAFGRADAAFAFAGGLAVLGLVVADRLI